MGAPVRSLCGVEVGARWWCHHLLAASRCTAPRCPWTRPPSKQSINWRVWVHSDHVAQCGRIVHVCACMTEREGERVHHTFVMKGSFHVKIQTNESASGTVKKRVGVGNYPCSQLLTGIRCYWHLIAFHLLPQLYVFVAIKSFLSNWTLYLLKNNCYTKLNTTLITVCLMSRNVSSVWIFSNS